MGIIFGHYVPKTVLLYVTLFIEEDMAMASMGLF